MNVIHIQKTFTFKFCSHTELAHHSTDSKQVEGQSLADVFPVFMNIAPNLDTQSTWSRCCSQYLPAKGSVLPHQPPCLDLAVSLS